MKKLHIILLAALFAGAPVAALAEEFLEVPESEIAVTTIEVKGASVRVCGANGETLEIYNLAGDKIATYRIDSADKTIEHNLKRGCYIFKIGKLARKVSVR